MSPGREPFPDPLTATAADLRNLLDNATIKSTNLVEIYLRQIAAMNNTLRAVICTAPREKLWQQAQQLDDERAQGLLRSPLHGIPILLKDTIATHPDYGMDTTAGSLALVGSRPKGNADVVDKLIAAGALILGKANLSELGYFKGQGLMCGWSAVGGQSQSAYVPGGLVEDGTPGGHSNPGGSSSGSAIAVSAGMAPVSLGAETFGSLIFPAARAALYTIKPTIGVVSGDGIVPLSRYFDAAGPMTKSALDLANVLDIIAESDAAGRPPGGYASVVGTKTWADLKVGVLDPSEWRIGDAFVRPDASATRQMNEAYAAAYATIESQAKRFCQYVTLPKGEELQYEGQSIILHIITATYKSELAAYTSTLESSKVCTLEELVEFNNKHADLELPPQNPNQKALEGALASQASDEDILKALAVARSTGREHGVDKTLQDNDIDVIIGPSESEIFYVAAAAGYPIASLPVGYLGLNGRPFGLAALASGGQDALLVQVQSAWEATFPPRQPPDLSWVV